MTTSAGAPRLSFDAAVQQVPFLRSLPPRDLERLRPQALCRRLGRGDRLWAAGDPTREFVFLTAGRVKQTKCSEAGREVIIQVWGPGQLLCTSAFCGSAAHCCTSVALEDDVEVVSLQRRELLDLLETSSVASQAFLREVTGRELNLSRRIEELSSGQVERRMATLLLRFAEQVGVAQGADSTSIPIRLSRQDLAELCGTTTETAIRVMSRLAREGIVRTEKAGFVVTDRNGLERASRGEAEP